MKLIVAHLASKYLGVLQSANEPLSHVTCINFTFSLPILILQGRW